MTKVFECTLRSLAWSLLRCIMDNAQAKFSSYLFDHIPFLKGKDIHVEIKQTLKIRIENYNNSQKWLHLWIPRLLTHNWVNFHSYSTIETEKKKQKRYIGNSLWANFRENFLQIFRVLNWEPVGVGGWNFQDLLVRMMLINGANFRKIHDMVVRSPGWFDVELPFIFTKWRWFALYSYIIFIMPLLNTSRDALPTDG